MSEPLTPAQFSALMERGRPERRLLSSLIPWDENPRLHPEEQIRLLCASIESHGFLAPFIIQASTGIMVAGHGRRISALRLAKKYQADPMVPVVLADLTDEEARSYAIADNRITDLSTWDVSILKSHLAELDTGAWNMEATGYDLESLGALFGAGEAEKLGGDDSSKAGELSRKFGAPPFTVLDPNQAYWQARAAQWAESGLSCFDAKVGDWITRKEAWIALGLRSDEGRDSDLIWSHSSHGKEVYFLKNELMKASGGISPSWEEIEEEAEKRGIKLRERTSIFDPVLCELLVSWFCPAAGRVIDPFAGGSVRGIVSTALGRSYTGIDLRPEQVAANVYQWNAIAGEGAGALPWAKPDWIVGDSMDILELVSSIPFDFMLSCPPYADLEVYSDKEGDLSHMEFPEFLSAYRQIIDRTASLLAPNRFAAWVVGEIRGPDGSYRNFVPETIKAFNDAGMTLYNEAVLLIQLASLPIRAGRQFTSSRKMGKAHQNVLIFVKGDPAAAVEALGDVQIMNPFAQAAVAFEARKDLVSCP
jgi:hypothetical protein